ncbi:AdoMet-dependent rRNA methyltransferase spb1 [Pyrenophora tritici-repentis]|uniref:AdoMet-dependent rRNA methyltransferase spb1 n=2 Tax=Pyrenophora tritici-repentis TaxID=45151 RepID=A0A922NHK8_9PLEO|nr:AdoMet-dependent rRNA methyltransferase spb-1 [Pyrenophora tritici-repentis Pt-1C-BFP]EDU42903.1 AdoMet-dependent rRNA methyltransferase spb-1 [Pyrenophora tritici-repentis Pt-1C-BFP]KAI1516051.1 AdoMet-dependent rRNA methyltransferase spb1 [Pyrenophora tritici-repentis]KAI1671697.1 AdoMet-dependent rRNA methyltransferase spb1 [Pyrenophora tritici-repentis]KAI1685540.1 AdoMet-dependent rRNA methyltransferase spb1 [Pyrenophora tritici-repentis]
MAIQKKHGKGRLDKWYKLAKEKGYRARAAFKLIQLNKKYNFLEKSKVLIDLCAAPGSWCQVASEVMPAHSLIVGVDLAPIKPIPRCITFQSDITTDKCRATLRQHLKHLKCDTVLHDGAPNVGTAWVQDAFTQAELVLQSMKLATEFLAEGGTFVTKIFRSKDYNSLLWVFNQLFAKVEATKPPSSRNVSAEIFVVCRGYKAPKNLDPRFLDARSVFAELADPTPNNEAKVFKPELKKRKREGYEEGDWTQFKEAPVSDFIQTTDPIAMLGGLNKLSFEQKPNGDIAVATIDKLPETTKEIRDCCADLKVLGRADFKRLLRWRLRVREIFGFATKKTKVEDEAKAKEAKEGEEVAEIESMDEEMQIQEELERMKEKESKSKKKQRRAENERKQKEITRLQMNMTTPFELGMEQAGGDDSMFALKAVDKAGAINKIAKGKMAQIVEREKQEEVEEELETDDEEDHLERDLDAMYGDYVEQRSARDAKYRAKRARKQDDDGEWNGFSDEDKEQSDDEELVQDADSDWSDDEEEGPKGLITDLDNEEQSKQGLTKRAARFFDQDIFKGIDGLDDLEDDEDSGIDVEGDTEMKDETVTSAPAPEAELSIRTTTNPAPSAFDEESSDDEDKIEEVARDETQWEQDNMPMKNGRPDIDIITAEAMTLAHQMATGQKSKHDLLDESFNRYSLRDVDGLPDWFLDDENRHSKLQRPTTAAAASAIKEKLRALNARPIKKVREAQARKKFKAAQRLEKLKKKSALLADEEGMTEKEKAQSIARLMSRAAKKKPKQKVSVIVAKGGNKGIKNRPKGTKGKYKMVDARLKKDVRGEKRAAKKNKKR